MWHERHHEMASAVRSPVAVFPGVSTHHGSAPSERFAVYRNNAIVNTRTHLAAVFPVSAMLLGDDCFNDVARSFIVAAPPLTPVLLEYGAGFPAYLASTGLTETLPYIVDVAALEWARYRAYHAADADSVDISVMAAIDDAEIDRIRLTLHPSISLIRSSWPVVSIWQAHQQSDPASVLRNVQFNPEIALVLRPALEVHVRSVREDAGTLLQAIIDGKLLGEALDAAAQTDRPDLSAALSGAFICGTITAAALNLRN